MNIFSAQNSSCSSLGFSDSLGCARLWALEVLLKGLSPGLLNKKLLLHLMDQNLFPINGSVAQRAPFSNSRSTNQPCTFSLLFWWGWKEGKGVGKAQLALILIEVCPSFALLVIQGQIWDLGRLKTKQKSTGLIVGEPRTLVNPISIWKPPVLLFPSVYPGSSGTLENQGWSSFYSLTSLIRCKIHYWGHKAHLLPQPLSGPRLGIDPAPCTTTLECSGTGNSWGRTLNGLV